MAHSSSSSRYGPSRQYGQTTSYISTPDYGSGSSSSSIDTWERDTWEDLPPSVVFTASGSSSSVATYDSAYSETEESAVDCSTSDDDDDDDDDASFSSGTPPAVLPHRYAPVSETSVQPSDPETFARLFPSMDRLSIRHDDRTADGNMNLRVDTVVPDPSSRRRRPATVQLFHLRMHDLARREFSLRRYGRDSGREVCSAKGAKPQPTSSSSLPPRPGFQRTVSAALKSVKTSFRRSSSAAPERAAAALSTSPSSRRPSTASNSSWGCGSVFSIGGSGSGNDNDNSPLDAKDNTPPSARPIPADTIKLEFSNYARVDVRRAKKCYEFEWWGHNYAWRRVVDKTLGQLSLHLIRDGGGEPVALIVPEARSPNQVVADKVSGAWVPPCYMWICDKSILEPATDVADIIVSAGLMALVDDSINQRWPAKKIAKARPAAPTRPHRPVAGANSARPQAFVRGLFNRAHSAGFSPLRFGYQVVAY